MHIYEEKSVLFRMIINKVELNPYFIKKIGAEENNSKKTINLI